MIADHQAAQLAVVALCIMHTCEDALCGLWAYHSVVYVSPVPWSLKLVLVLPMFGEELFRTSGRISRSWVLLALVMMCCYTWFLSMFTGAVLLHAGLCNLQGSPAPCLASSCSCLPTTACRRSGGYRSSHLPPAKQRAKTHADALHLLDGRPADRAVEAWGHMRWPHL